jgi:hypothetical protein
MTKERLEKKVAKLESICDQFQAEFNHLNRLLKHVGFEKGIASLKEAANDLLLEREENDLENE